MEQYEERRKKNEFGAEMRGVVCTVLVHLVFLCIGFSSGMKYPDPPPPETSFLINFSDNEEFEIFAPAERGREPKSETADKNKPVNLVQISKSDIKGKRQNESQEALADKKGDIEIEQPEREKEINRKALFPAADNKSNKDTVSAQTASRISDALKGGHASGNTEKGKINGEPNAHLEGRNLVGTIPVPSYIGKDEGTIVVEILVDRYGKVTDAVAGAKGTTIPAGQLWVAARNAAKKAHFSMSAEAPVKQRGTITFVFKLKK